jgi:hypothetical protein
MKFLSSLLLYLTCTLFVKAQISLHHLPLADSFVMLQKQYFGKQTNKTAYIHLHANETTALTTVKNFLAQNQGVLIHITNAEQRNVIFNNKNKKYTIDPNRIFTTNGIKKTLQHLSTYNTITAIKVQQFADTLLSFLKPYNIWIAIHNNTNNNYSILSYTKGKEEYANTDRIFINKNLDPDDFFYTTHEGIFNKLKDRKMNVVLQKKIGFINDGSLSVYCGLKNIPYVNVEAEEGHQTEQMKMLQILHEVLEELYP